MITLLLLLSADGGVDGADSEQNSSEVQHQDGSSPSVSGGHEEATSPEPPDTVAEEGPEELHEGDEECEDGGQSPISLNLTAVTSHQFQQKECVIGVPPSAVSTLSPSAGCCEQQTLDPDGAEEPSEDTGGQEDEKSDIREERSNVSLSSLEQADVETGQGAEPSDETC